jgi:hypothetical protein
VIGSYKGRVFSVRYEQTVPTREGASRYKLAGAVGHERGPRPDIVAYVFVFLGSNIICQLYKLTFWDKDQVTLQLSQSFQFSVMIFSRSALAGVPKKNFYRDLNPLSAALRTEAWETPDDLKFSAADKYDISPFTKEVQEIWYLPV